MKMERVKSEYVRELTQNGRVRCGWVEFGPRIPFLSFNWHWRISKALGWIYQCTEEATETVERDDPAGKQLLPYCLYHKEHFIDRLVKDYEKAAKKHGDFLGVLSEKGDEENGKTLATFSADEDGCCHVSIAKQILVRDGKIQPLICPHCNTENHLPLHFSLDSTNKYFLECQYCGRTLWRKGSQKFE